MHNESAKILGHFRSSSVLARALVTGVLELSFYVLNRHFFVNISVEFVFIRDRVRGQ